MEYSYECSICDRSLISSFYMCSNSHVTCFHCCSTATNACRLCGLGKVYCCEYSKFRLDEANGLIFRRAKGPVIVLPLSKESVRPRIDAAGDRRCDSSWLNSVSCCSQLMKCLDCRKCIFQSRVLEHYVNEHKDTLICPVPPQSMVALQIRSQDFERTPRKLLILQLMDIADSSSTIDDVEPSLEGDEKLFFVMGSEEPFIGKLTMLKLWVTATFHACNTTYSMEVANPGNDSVSTLFSGSPINASNSLALDQGQCFYVRRSLVEHFEKNGGCNLNLYVHT